MGHEHGAGAEDCYVCRKPAGFNRAIVDPHHDVEIGRICMNCERDRLEDRFAGAESTDGSCAHCDREGAYALPRYEPIAVETDAATVSMVSTTLDSTPIRLCEHHLRDLRVAGEGSADVVVRERKLVG